MTLAGVCAAALLLLAGCQASLDLDEFVIEESRPLACAAGEQRCNGDAVQTCVEGDWTAPTACPDERPLCNQGRCATMRLSGGLGTQHAAGQQSSLRVVDARLHAVAPSCGTVQGRRVCVRGQLGP